MVAFNSWEFAVIRKKYVARRGLLESFQQGIGRSLCHAFSRINQIDLGDALQRFKLQRGPQFTDLFDLDLTCIPFESECADVGVMAPFDFPALSTGATRRRFVFLTLKCFGDPKRARALAHAFRTREDQSVRQPASPKFGLQLGNDADISKKRISETHVSPTSTHDESWTGLHRWFREPGQL